MIEQIDWASVPHIDRIGQALLRKPIADISRLAGFSTISADDDLGYFEGQSFMLDGTVPFFLVTYLARGDSTILYLPSYIATIDQITSTTSRIIEWLNIPPELVEWKRETSD